MPPPEPKPDPNEPIRDAVASSQTRATVPRGPGDSDPEAMAETLKAPGDSGTHLVEGTLLEGTYRVERLLGRGAMGAVYLVEHVALGTKFAAKVVAAGMDAASMARLKNEARIASGIDHENIVRVTHLGTTDSGNAFVVMERLTGEDLRARHLRHRRDAERDGGEPWLGDAEIRAIVGPLLSALQAAHEAGVVHRDLKPENVFLHERQGRVVPKIVDFGIGKLHAADEDLRLTATGQIVGTPLYMAPEQTRSSSLVEPRSDLYSFGVMLFELLTGRLPFEASNVYEIVVKHVTEAPPDARSLRPDLPEAVAEVVQRCLAKAPEDRFESAAALADAWEAAWGGGSVAPLDAPLRESEPRVAAPRADSSDRDPRVATSAPTAAAVVTPAPASRAAMVAIGGLIGALAVGGILWVALDRSPTPPPAASPAVVEVPPEPPVAVPEPTEAAPEPAIAAPAPPAPADPTPLTRRLESDPAGAEVYRDGVRIGTTPLDLEIPEGTRVEVELRHRGRASVTRTVGADDPEIVQVDLPRRRSEDRRFPGLAPQ